MFACDLESEVLGRSRTGTAGNLLFIAASLMMLGCMNLDTSGGLKRDVFSGADTTLTLIQQIDAGTLLYYRDAFTQGASDRRYTLGYAAAVAAYGNDIYVVDQASGQLVRINLSQSEASVLMTLPDPRTHGIHVRPDRTIFVVDRNARGIRQLDESGRMIRLFSDQRLMPAPVDVTETDWGNIIVAVDELSNQLVLFNTLGGPIDVIGSGTWRPTIAQTVHAIAATPNSVFVLDRDMGEVMRFSLRGDQTGNYGEDELAVPTALAIDHCGRLFMADQSGQGILVSSTDMMLPSGRARQDDFLPDQITDLWVDSGALYIAAGIQGISIYLVEPPCAAQ